MLLKKFFLLLFIFPTTLVSAQTKTNIIYMMADDLGYADLSCYGRKDYQTPNLDKLCSGDKPYPDTMRWTSGGSPNIYAAMMKSLDDAIGRIVKAIDDLKLSNN